MLHVTACYGLLAKHVILMYLPLASGALGGNASLTSPILPRLSPVHHLNPHQTLSLNHQITWKTYHILSYYYYFCYCYCWHLFIFMYYCWHLFFRNTNATSSNSAHRVVVIIHTSTPPCVCYGNTHMFYLLCVTVTCTCRIPGIYGLARMCVLP